MFGSEAEGTEKEQTERLKALARRHAPDAVGVLSRVMNDDTQPGAARVVAAKTLLDRGFGAPERKARTEVDVTIVDQRKAHFEALQRLAARHQPPAVPGTPADPGPVTPGHQALTAGRLQGIPRAVIEDVDYQEL